MSTIERARGRIVLIVAHLAGMIDLVALPLWVGALMSHYGLDAQHAGALVTAFLVGVVVASLGFASRFERLSARFWAPAGYFLACLAFVGLAFARDERAMAVLHAAGGLAVGCGLSFVHGTIGRSANPHRLWAIVGLALGVFAIVVLGGAPLLVHEFGGPALFVMFALVMGAAALATAIHFPLSAPASGSSGVDDGRTGGSGASVPLSAGLRWAVAGVVCLTITQSMMFSFVERIGAVREFGVERVVGVLIAIGAVNLFPSALAGLLQYRLPAPKVAVAGPAVQALLASTIAWSSTFAPYAVATSFLSFVTIFTHTFVFGMIARLDPSGRAVALTPAMLMTGSAVGPILGGTLVVHFGYRSLGLAAVAIATIGVIAFARLGAAARGSMRARSVSSAGAP